MRLLIVLIAGALLPLAFAPINIYSLSFFSLATLCYFWMDAKPSQAFWTGLVYGIGFFSVGVSWVFISINTYGNTPLLISIVMTALFILIFSVYIALQGWIVRRFFHHSSNAIFCLCVFPAMWVIWEWVRATAFTGFPWLLIGYTQMSTPLKGFAPIIGVYGVSLIVAFIGGCLVLLLRSNPIRIKIISAGFIFAFILAGWVLKPIQWTKPIGTPITTSLIQGNVAQTMKWEPQHLTNILNKYKHLTEQHWKSRLIIWPEAAIPAFPQDVQGFINQINQAAKTKGVYLIAGLPMANTITQKYYNGLLMMGAGSGQYLKRHLVPFGEYMPLQFLFNWFIKYFNVPMSNFSAGPYHQAPLKVDSFNIAPFICYEIAYPSLVLDSAENAQMLLLIVDDSWFGNSLAPYQHIQMAQMRSLETGRYTLVSTNTGVTTFINPKGKMLITAPLDKTEVITHDVIAMAGKTPLMIWRYYPVIFIMLLMLLAGCF